MGELRVRPATLADVAAILAIEARAGREDWSEQSVRERLTHPHGACLVGELDGTVVAHVLALLVAGEAEIITLAVDPDHQRRGHARTLLQGARARWSAERIVLEVRVDNTAARALYAVCGLREVGRRTAYYADGTDAVILGG